MVQIGDRFGRLTVQEVIRDRAEPTKCRCLCDCGNEVIVFAQNLRTTNPHTTSCGCLKAEIVKAGPRRTHGWSKTRIYRIWKYMRKRCYNQNASNYERYGGRGISVCSEWNDNFENFLEWAMANGYNDSLSLDRIDNNANYTPENCRWTDDKVQSNNRRSNRYVEYDGRRMTIAQWAHELNMPVSTLEQRFIHGWDVERALTEPLRKCPRKDKDEDGSHAVLN